MDFEKVKKYKKTVYADLSFEVLSKPEELNAYLYSGSIHKLNSSELTYLLKNLRKSYQSATYELLFNFIDFSFETANMYWSNALDNAKGLCAEDILSQAEFLGSRMLAKNISVDGNEYNEDIINSQHDFLLGVMPVLIKFITENKVYFSGKPSNVKKGKSTKLIESLSHYQSTNSHLNEVLKGFYSVKSIDHLCEKYSIKEEAKVILDTRCKFFMGKSEENFELLETYRDLNYRLEYQEENNLEIQAGLMRKSKFGKHYTDIDLLHFDFSKGGNYEIELQFHKVSEFIVQIYSSLDTSFRFKNLEFKVSDLIDLSKEIYRLANQLNKRNLSNLSAKKSNFISIKGQKSLIKTLGVNKNLELLIPLFTASNHRGIENSPLLSSLDLYYISPQHVVALCFEKVIDKILSNNEVTLILPKGIKKGHLFEERILDTFVSSGMETFTLKGNSNKGVPEIDALVSLDDRNVLVIEAKCSIKPESRFEAFSYIENHLQKAKQQLALRVDYLKSNADSVVNQGIPFSVSEKNIIPIIVTNHSYFTGMKLKISKDITVYCIDEFLLRKIVKEKIVPCWSYLPKQNSYGLDKIKVTNSQVALNAIKNPVSFLNGMVGKTIQILESGIAFEISKHATIDWQYKYNKEMNSVI
jgi:hypothetical protein